MAAGSSTDPLASVALDGTGALFSGAVARPHPPSQGPFAQTSLDDLGQPLSEVTFCVVDVETTGGSADAGGLTEIGAVKLRGGECLGTFQTLVNPGIAIPRQITVLTGITRAMVVPAPQPCSDHWNWPSLRCGPETFGGERVEELASGELGAFLRW